MICRSSSRAAEELALEAEERPMTGHPRRRLPRFEFLALAIGGVFVACGSASGTSTADASAPPDVGLDAGAPAIDSGSALGCGTASACGSRQYCNQARTCICIQSAEGTNQCGELPSSCEAQSCTTSADCANLGPGYFCDTPGSGCCDNPGEEHRRCMALCGEPDAPDGSADAALPDGNSFIGGGPPYDFDPTTIDFFQQAALAATGQPVDFDGDGMSEFQLTQSGTQMTVHVAPGGIDVFYYQYDSATGAGSKMVDADQNGMPEYSATYTGNPDTSAELFDDDGDGTYDRRTTTVYDYTTSTETITLETDPQHTGMFTQVDMQTIPLDRQTCSPPDGGPPSSDGGGGGCNNRAFVMGGTHSEPIWIWPSGKATDDPTGECSDAHVTRLKQGLNCVFSQGQTCLGTTNTLAYWNILMAFATGHLQISCGDHCEPADTVESTNPANCPWYDYTCMKRTTVSPITLDQPSPGTNALDDASVCSMLLHEVLHWANVPDDGANHNDGIDRVYACGRYCAGCVYNGVNVNAKCPIPTPNQDCTRCADTTARKKACGYREEVGPGPAFAVCTGGLACISQDCLDPKAKRVVDCDNNLLAQGPNLCCAACPSDCPTNSIACTTLPAPSDHCSDKPPACP
jgi:hypothetical protein